MDWSLLESCELCPRRCKADRLHGQRGVCGASSHIRVARAALHFWEEPPISGEEGSGAVFFSHCPLHCIYCQNEGIANGDIGCDISLERLVEIFFELQAQGARNINLVTPSHYALHIKEAIRIAREIGLTLPVVYNTSGYETPETIHMLDGVVDTYLTDFRYSDARAARAYSHAADYPEVARAALAAMVESGADVIVRILLLPGQLEATKRTLEYLVATYGDAITLSMMSQYTPMGAFPSYPELEQRVDPIEFEELLDFLDDLGVEDYFWQDGDAAQESFIPDFDACTGVLTSACVHE